MLRHQAAPRRVIRGRVPLPAQAPITPSSGRMKRASRNDKLCSPPIRVDSQGADRHSAAVRFQLHGPANRTRPSGVPGLAMRCALSSGNQPYRRPGLHQPRARPGNRAPRRLQLSTPGYRIFGTPLLRASAYRVRDRKSLDQQGFICHDRTPRPRSGVRSRFRMGILPV